MKIANVKLTTTNVSLTITNDQVMQVVRAMTINDPNFDPAPWSIWDAEVFETAAKLIRCKIAEAAQAKESREATSA